jgi:hypothetical protein
MPATKNAEAVPEAKESTARVSTPEDEAMSEQFGDRARSLAGPSHDPIDSSAPFDVTGNSTEHLEAAIAMAMARFRKVEFARTSASEISFFRYAGRANPAPTALPFAFDVIGVIDMAESFLRTQVKRPLAPDHDGSNSAGWRVRVMSYGEELRVGFHWLEHHK